MAKRLDAKQATNEGEQKRTSAFDCRVSSFDNKPH